MSLKFHNNNLQYHHDSLQYGSIAHRLIGLESHSQNMQYFSFVLLISLLLIIIKGSDCFDPMIVERPATMLSRRFWFSTPKLVRPDKPAFKFRFCGAISSLSIACYPLFSPTQSAAVLVLKLVLPFDLELALLIVFNLFCKVWMIPFDDLHGILVLR